MLLRVTCNLSFTLNNNQVVSLIIPCAAQLIEKVYTKSLLRSLLNHFCQQAPTIQNLNFLLLGRIGDWSKILCFKSKTMGKTLVNKEKNLLQNDSLHDHSCTLQMIALSHYK